MGEVVRLHGSPWRCALSAGLGLPWACTCARQGSRLLKLERSGGALEHQTLQGSLVQLAGAGVRTPQPDLGAK